MCLQEAFTESLVARLGTEGSNPVRRSLSHLLASVLRLPEFGVDKTKHVLQLLAAPILHPQQQTQGPEQLKLLQVATVEVFTAYVENSADGDQPFFDELVHIFQQGEAVGVCLGVKGKPPKATGGVALFAFSILQLLSSAARLPSWQGRP